MTAVGERVYVEDYLFNGWGTVQHIIPGEMFPIQVELDEGDAGGHKVFRVHPGQIVNTSKTTEPGMLFKTKEDRFIGTSLMDGIRMKKGAAYVLGPVLYTWGRVAEDSPRHCYVYAIEKDCTPFIGCFPLSVFRDIKPYGSEIIVEEAVVEEPKQPEPEPIEVTVKGYEQATIFDFL